MIPIFQHEIKDGLADVIKANASVAFNLAIREIEIPDSVKTEYINRAGASANPEQFDLFYLESILVSTGWNKNDDVFDRFETWAARNTPVDKQVNFMHNELDIVGHITSAKLVDFDGKLIADDIPFDDIPNNFDIVVGSVIYKYWADENRQNKVREIIESIRANKCFVSMECLFKNFDYALVSPDGVNKVIARNEDSSFLTKHLRWYGGSGEYEGYKIGRLLRNFGFSGKGLVSQPANPRSLITNFNSSRETSAFAAKSISTLNELTTENEIMTVTADKVDVVSKAQYDELKAKLDAAQASAEKATSEKIQSLEAKVEELSKANESLTAELEASKEVSTAKEEKVQALKTQVEETEAKLTEANEKLESINKEIAKSKRLAVLVSAGVSQERAATLVDKFANASEDMFSALVDSLSDAEYMKDKKEDKNKKEKEKKDKESMAQESLDNAEVNETEDINLSLSSENEEDEIMKSAASWFSGAVLKYAAPKK